MREYTDKPQSTSRTLDGKPQASKQAPIATILQAYKAPSGGAGLQTGNGTVQLFHSFHSQTNPSEVDLADEERNGGHTIDRHLCTRAQAILRIQSEGQIPTSYWPDLATAQGAVQQLVNTNWINIKGWARIAGNGQMELQGNNNQGTVMYGDLVNRESEQAKMYLSKAQPAADRAVDVRVVTCYPTLNHVPTVGETVGRVFSISDNRQSLARREEQERQIERTSKTKKKYKAKPKFGKK